MEIKEFIGQMRVKRVDPKEYGVVLGGFSIAQSGSSVYEGVDPGGKRIAFKEYDIVKLSAEELRAYQRITNMAAELVSDLKVSIPNLRGESVIFNLSVVLIDELGVNKTTHNACSISRFIDGANLVELLGMAEAKKAFTPFPEIFTEANKDEVLAVLEKTSQELNRGLGTEGVSLVPPNLKPKETDGPTLIVTDLYAQLGRLQKDAKRLKL